MFIDWTVRPSSSSRRITRFREAFKKNDLLNVYKLSKDNFKQNLFNFQSAVKVGGRGFHYKKKNRRKEFAISANTPHFSLAFLTQLLSQLRRI